MDLAYLILIVLAVIYVPIWVWVWRKPEQAERYHLCKYGPCIMIKTRLGFKTMDRLCKYTRFWRAFGFFSKLVSAVLFLLMMYMLVVAIIAVPSRMASGSSIGIEYALAIPGLNPMLPLVYGVIAFVVAMVVHELGHGIQARANGARLRALVDDRDVDFSRKDGLDGHFRKDLKLHVRMRFGVVVEKLREVLLLKLDRRGKSKHAPGRGAHGMLFEHLPEAPHEGLGLKHELQALDRGRKRTPRAVKERAAQLLFKTRNPARHPRNIRVHQLGGLRDVARVGRDYHGLPGLNVVLEAHARRSRKADDPLRTTPLGVGLIPTTKGVIAKILKIIDLIRNFQNF